MRRLKIATSLYISEVINPHHRNKRSPTVMTTLKNENEIKKYRESECTISAIMLNHNARSRGVETRKRGQRQAHFLGRIGAGVDVEKRLNRKASAGYPCAGREPYRWCR